MLESRSEIQKVLGLFCAEQGWSKLSMATKWKLTDPDIMELILKYHSDAHPLEDEDISPRRDTDTDSDKDDITDTNCTQGTDSRHTAKLLCL
jgi:hypothetical protein